jgi:hypothetical protein
LFKQDTDGLAANFRQLRELRRGKRRLGACVAYFIGPFAATQRCVDPMITDTSDCLLCLQVLLTLKLFNRVKMRN